MIKAGQIERPKTVLVVDDQEINRDVLEAILEEQYEILFAENGREALEMIRAHQEELSVIMLDLMMPVMNGFEVLQKLREDEELQKIPVIVLTAEREAELRALQAGAADFITKPFDEVEVIQARVGRIIEMSEGRKLISAAERDALSGLYSRNFYNEYASRLFRYHPELRLDAVVLNIEQFHSVNALHGRAFGELSRAAEALSAGAGQALPGCQHPPADGRVPLGRKHRSGDYDGPGPVGEQHGPGKLQEPHPDLRRGDAAPGDAEAAAAQRSEPGARGEAADGFLSAQV